MYRRWRVLCGVCALGCSGEEFGNSSIDENSTSALSELSTSERDELCERLLARLDEQVDAQQYEETTCTGAAWTITQGDAALCQSAYDACASTLPRPSPSELVTCSDHAPVDSACVEVRDMYDCYRDMGQAISESPVVSMGPHSCQEAVDNPPPPTVQVTVPTSCTVITLSHEDCL